MMKMKLRGRSRGGVQRGVNPHSWDNLQCLKYISSILGEKKKHEANLKSFLSGTPPPKKNRGSSL